MYEHLVRLAENSDISEAEEVLREKEEIYIYVWYCFNYSFFTNFYTAMKLAEEVMKDLPNKTYRQMELVTLTLESGNSQIPVTAIRVMVPVEEFIALRKNYCIYNLR